MVVTPALSLPLPRLAMNKIGNRVGLGQFIQARCLDASRTATGIRGNRPACHHDFRRQLRTKPSICIIGEKMQMAGANGQDIF
jgi:hypothetical protein